MKVPGLAGSIMAPSWREEFLESVSLCLTAADVLHMEGHFPHSYLTRMEVFLVERCAAVYSMLLYLHTASNHFKSYTVITHIQTHF